MPDDNYARRTNHDYIGSFGRIPNEPKMGKCSFLKKHIQYLAHIVSGEGIKPVPEKLSAIQQMPRPYTPKEVKQFLGLVGYYRRFIPRYADIVRPLHALTRKDTSFEWSDICQRSFDLLKAMVSEEPILVYPDPFYRCK